MESRTWDDRSQPSPHVHVGLSCQRRAGPVLTGDISDSGSGRSASGVSGEYQMIADCGES